MNSTLLLAVAALGLGLLLTASGSVLLAHARAAARTSHGWQSAVSQYPAALSALMGLVVTSAAGGVVCWHLAPLRGATAVLVAMATGIVVFAAAGAGFARLADRVETRRVHRVPDEVRRPVSPGRPGPRALPPSNPEPTPAPETTPASEPEPTPGPGQRPETGPLSTGTPLVEVRRTPRNAIEPSSDRPAPTVSVRGERGRPLEPGWMYHDEAGAWFLAVGTPAGGTLLLGLPAFALVDPNGPDAPAGELTRAGAGELTVVPDAPALPGPEGEAPRVPDQRSQSERFAEDDEETGLDPG